MKKLTIHEAEVLASKFRFDNGLSQSGPINTKTLLRKLEITAMYRPLSDASYGISCRSNTGRQHFTIAHELYHLFYDEALTPHMCQGTVSGTERNANMFDSALLLPREGVLQMVSP